jgi:hypothetical protein
MNIPTSEELCVYQDSYMENFTMDTPERVIWGMMLAEYLMEMGLGRGEGGERNNDLIGVKSSCYDSAYWNYLDVDGNGVGRGESDLSGNGYGMGWGSGVGGHSDGGGSGMTVIQMVAYCGPPHIHAVVDMRSSLDNVLGNGKGGGGGPGVRHTLPLFYCLHPMRP